MMRSPSNHSSWSRTKIATNDTLLLRNGDCTAADTFWLRFAHYFSSAFFIAPRKEVSHMTVKTTVKSGAYLWSN